jgi:predicted TPR repeat methyltransferase
MSSALATHVWDRDRLWRGFRRSWLWRVLRRSSFLRSAFYLRIELHRSRREPAETTQEFAERFFDRSDPWDHRTHPKQIERFVRQAQLLDRVRSGAKFPRALEIGCAEGAFTEILADRCNSLIVVDIAPTALVRASARREWSPNVRFEEWDLGRQPIDGRFDLIVAGVVLEYFHRRRTFRTIRTKIVGALNPGGYLLLASTKPENPVVERAWWTRYVVRGKWIHRFVGRHSALRIVEEFWVGDFIVTLFRKL